MLEGERLGWDPGLAAPRQHGAVSAGLQHAPARLPADSPPVPLSACRGVPDRLHMQDVGTQSWKKKLAPKAPDFQKK